MITLLVIADDFTGALDTGVQFSKQGIPTLVTTGEQSLPAHVRSAVEVLVVDIESRHLPAGEARAAVERVARTAIAAGVRHVYKKTDSTLRGNIGAELEALLRASGEESLAFAPAFPRSRRTTVNGIQYVDGIKLGDTVFADDPFMPVKHSSVAEIIRQQSAVSVAGITADRYDEAGALHGEKTIRIYDAQTDQDMERLGAALKAANKLRVLAGCAGFAEFLPGLLGLRPVQVEWQGNRDNILIVSGSVNQITINQMTRAKNAGYHVVTLTAEQKLDRDFPGSEACGLFAGQVAEALSRHKKVIVESVRGREQLALSEQYAVRHGIPRENLRSLISGNMGGIVRHILDTTPVGNLVVFGGDTLYSIMNAVGCEGIVPVLEISPGVAAAKTLSRDRDFSLITKSGGLGDEDVVMCIDRFVFGGDSVLEHPIL